MAGVETKDIRNVILIGHGGCGKTILAEALLHACGATTRIGSIAEGTTLFDFNPDEKAKRHSIDATTAHAIYKGVQINLIDAPGYPDHIGAALGALAAVETALVVVNAAAGIEVNTRRMWKEAADAGLARMVIVARMDGENVDAAQVLSQIQEQFSERCLPMNLPVGEGHAFRGVENVLSPSESPAETIGEVGAAHDRLVEAVVEADDATMETYLETGEIGTAELFRVAAKAVATGGVVPVLFCAALKGLGVGSILDAIAQLAPSPVTGKVRVALDAGGHAVPVEPTAEGPLFGQVFKMVTDPFVGKMSYVRIFGGTLTPDRPIYNVRTERSEKIGNLLRLQGKEQQAVASARPGEIVAISKLDDIRIGDTLCSQGAVAALPAIRFPTPMVSLAVTPKSRKDEQKISASLVKLTDEDATLVVRRDAQISQLVVTGMSDLHLETMLGRLKERFEVEVNTSLPKVPYKETIVKAAEGHYRHKKQTGGRGQFGEVYLKVEPIERGGGFEFVDEVVGASIPGQYLPAVEKGVREALGRGVIAGYEFIDVRVRVYDGKHHPVDSSEAAFKMAGSRAFRLAALAANPVLLEPIVIMEIAIPSPMMGDITGDLNSRRGRILGVDTEGANQVIKAQVPLAEVMSYSTQLRSMTGGEGSYTMEFSHLDIVPGKVADSIKAQFKGHADEE